MNILFLPLYLIFPIIFFISFMLALAGHYLLKKYRLNEVLLENNEFISITYPIVGLVYGVLLAFTIVIVWGQYLDAEESVTHEVIHLSELWRNSQVFPDQERNKLQGKMCQYVNTVIKEMQVQRERTREVGWNGKSTVIYESIWDFYYIYQPQTEAQKVFYTKSLDQINQLGEQRRLRIMYSKAEIHQTLWVFLLCGGVVTMGFVFFIGCKSNLIRITVSTLLSSLIISSIYLVYTFQHPFEGVVSISSDPYQILKQSFVKRTVNDDTSPCHIQGIKQ